ncbi:MAG: GAF domain-containing protein [Actinomycetota bacterium]|nr:GAF domain-containing protein [Actinomycetota bacterium]
MARNPVPGGVVPIDGQDLAAHRIRFLTADRPEPSRVRAPILASWRRSRELKVAADKIVMPYLQDPNFDTPLTRSAEPVLRRLREKLDGEPVSIILTDQTGLVLSRRTGTGELERHLDRVLLAPGFSYAEEFVGTNGIGTALEVGTGTQVFGHEHYAENLDNLACAGVPIRDPISGRTIGAVDLTCWRKEADSLLLVLAETTAEQIRQAMLNDSGFQELEVFRAYLRACRRTSGIVFAMTGESVMVNDYARAVLDPADQAALLTQAAEAAQTLEVGRRRSVEVGLPTGTAARMHCQRVGVDARTAGVVVNVKLGDTELRVLHRQPQARMLLPGLVGDAPLWQRACQEVETAFNGGEWLALAGEPGVGKLALLRAVQLRQQPARRFAEFDAGDAETDRNWLAEVRRALAGGAETVVVRHADRLDRRRLRSLSAALDDARSRKVDGSLWAAVTLSTAAPGPEFNRLLRLFPVTVDVPPLRLRLDDVPLLVSFFLAKLANGAQISCSPEAMRLLMRSSWPGNVEQVYTLLHQVVRHRRVGSIQPHDLPPETQSMTRRTLSPLESMERDAIVRSLTDAQGNKLLAARSLGMSRATIYRKIHEYGIVPGKS